MKKIILLTLVLSLLILSSCATVRQYLPSHNDSTGFVIVDNPFVFTNETENNATIGPSENASVIVENETETSPEEPEETVPQEKLEENASPVLTTIEVVEGDLVSLSDLVAEDPDGDPVEYTYSAPLDADGFWQTNDGDAGKYLVTVEASDGLLSTKEKIQLVVLPSNKGPVIDCPDKFTAQEGDYIELPCTIYDKEGDEVSYSVSGFMHELTYQTDYEDAGNYTIFVSASDGNKHTSKEIELEIKNTNRAPVVKELAPIKVLEGEDVQLSLDVSDADNDTIEIEYPLLFDDEGLWKTKKGDAGTYELEAIVSDGTDEVKVPINILVEKVNVAPVIEEIAPIIVDEGETIELPVVVTDEDGDEVQVTISGFMTSETYTTTFDDAGEHEVLITATDGKHSVSQTVKITVNDVNRPPVFILK